MPERGVADVAKETAHARAPRTEARVSNDGVLIKIPNDTQTIRISPFVYRGWKHIRRWFA